MPLWFTSDRGVQSQVAAKLCLHRGNVRRDRIAQFAVILTEICACTCCCETIVRIEMSPNSLECIPHPHLCLSRSSTGSRGA